MMRRFTLVLLAISCAMLTGCWDYRGLDTLDIVTGLAIDKDALTGEYLLTLEIIDIQGGPESLGTLYVECSGETIFSALRNSKRRLINKLYGGNLQTLIISRQIAETEGVDIILEELLRDNEPRETLTIVISEEETAKELLLTDGLDSRIIAYEIHEMVIEDSMTTASTKNVPLHKAYDATHTPGSSLVLPVLHRIDNNGMNVAESNGIALFRGDRLIAIDGPKETMAYLFLVDEVGSGALAFPITSPDVFISVEIKRSKTDVSVSMQDGQLDVYAHVKVKLNPLEIKGQQNLMHVSGRDELENRVEQEVTSRMLSYFQHAQAHHRTDTLGLGLLVYRQDPALWRAYESVWDDVFQKARLHVTVEADILTAGVLKNY